MIVARHLLLAAALTVLGAGSASAQACRALEITTSQCTWMVLQEIGGDRRAAAQAEQEATSTLIDGCSQGEYQMVLLRGTGVTDAAAKVVRSRRARDPRQVRSICASIAAQVAR